MLGIQPDEDDLNSIDTYTWQTFKTLRKNAKKIKSQEEFEAIVCQNFTFGIDEVPLCEDGANRMVNQTNLEEFIKLTCDHIFNAAQKQLKWIKEGIELMLPMTLMGLVQWNEAEDRICGMKTIDIDKLKSITEYYCCDENTKVIKMFWTVFDRISDEDKTLYLKFAWGRSRLPYDCSGLRYKHTL